MSVERESHISINERHEFSKIPRELKERLLKVTDVYGLLRSETSCEYFEVILSAMLLRFVSKPIVILECTSGYLLFLTAIRT